jgi:hypothetical protein
MGGPVSLSLDLKDEAKAFLENCFCGEKALLEARILSRGGSVSLFH